MGALEQKLGNSQPNLNIFFQEIYQTKNAKMVNRSVQTQQILIKNNNNFGKKNLKLNFDFLKEKKFSFDLDYSKDTVPESFRVFEEAYREKDQKLKELELYIEEIEGELNHAKMKKEKYKKKYTR